ncbi:membrane dipeptidase [Thalassotalea psychrophila]|uniref:Membrane dipeptidase n=1 Tax=Thalassotalea psychrophila TaxID=3065647 RepID=A0ABY9TZC1_9GAMM|nr:membrane dipeptidase [Colwelliaceae bacterium SQ149]
MKTQITILALTMSVAFSSFSYNAGDEAKVQNTGVHQGYSATADQYEVDGKVISNVDTKATLWNPRGKTEQQLQERGKFLGEAYDLSRSKEQQTRAKKAQTKYQDAIYINSVMIGSVGMVWMPEVTFADGIQRNLDSGASAVSVTAFAYPGDGEMPVMERLDRSRKIIDSNDDFVLIDGVDSILQAKKDGKIAVIFNTQGTDYAIDDPSQLDEAYKRGVRVTNMIYNNDNALAGGGSKQASGLTNLGKEMVQRANKLGMVMDCSHSSNQTCLDVAKTSTKPIVASHSNPDKLQVMGRNMSDEAMKAVASTGGAICSVGVGIFMNEDLDSSPERLVEQIVYTANLIGKDKTCYATDYMHNASDFFMKGVRQYEVFPPEKGFGAPATNIASEHIWDIVAILEQDHGWSEVEIRGFLGENLLRVYKANWK